MNARWYVLLLFLWCTGCGAVRIPRISISDPLLAGTLGIPAVPSTLVPYKDTPMWDLVHQLRYPDTPFGRRALAILADHRSGDLLAGGAVPCLKYIVLKSKNWKTRFNGISALEGIGPPHARSAVCTLWEIVYFDERFLREHAREAIKKFPSPPALGEEDCKNLWKKEGLTVFDSDKNGWEREPKKLREIYFY